MLALEEQTVLITGATDGLGRGLASVLAAEGATLMIHGRDEARGRQTLTEIEASTGNGKLRWLRADFSSLDEVRGLAASVAGSCDRLDVLVNNAGIGTSLPGEGRRMESRDGYELRFAVNYLAGYLLTRSLLPLLERRYSAVQAYCQSKLAQVMFTFDLAEELDGRIVGATCLHPATYMPTKMVRAAGVEPISTLEQGVGATLRLVGDPELEGVTGGYFSGLQPADPHPQASDPAARQQLRELSDRLCGLGG